MSAQSVVAAADPHSADVLRVASPAEVLTWSQPAAVALCRAIEAICPAYGCHVALTGGTLYKDGPRKDLDILFYRIRQVEAIDVDGLFNALADLGIEKVGGFGWCHKALFFGRKIDCFFPEESDGEYAPEPAAAFVDEVVF